MSNALKALKISFSSAEFESQPLLANVTFDNRETQCVPSDVSESTNQINEIETSLQGSYSSPPDDLEIQEDTFSQNTKWIVNTTSEKEGLQKGMTIFWMNLNFWASELMHSTLEPLEKIDFFRDDPSTFQLSSEKFDFKPQLTSFFVVSATYGLHFNPNQKTDFWVSYASRQWVQFQCSISENQKVCFLQMKFLRLHTDISGQVFQAANKRYIHHETYKQFWDDFPPILQKIFCFKTKSLRLFPHLIYFTILNLHLQLVHRKIMMFLSKFIRYAKISPERSLIIEFGCIIFSESDYIDPHCVPTVVFQYFPHLTIVFDHSRTDRSLKTCKVLASKHLFHSELFF